MDKRFFRPGNLLLCFALAVLIYLIVVSLPDLPSTNDHPRGLPKQGRPVNDQPGPINPFKRRPTKSPAPAQ